MTEGARSGAQDAESLLDRLWDTALDDDYYAPRPTRPGRWSRGLVAVTLFGFGLLATTAAVQSRSDQPASDLERAAVIEDIENRERLVDDQRDRLAELGAEVQGLRETSDVLDPVAEALGIITAEAPVRGPGLVITAESGGPLRGRVSDQDLQLMVNGLWYAGAEAISINGQRIGSMTAIRWAGESVTVNFRPVNEPYEVLAIGPASMAERWEANPSGRHWAHRSASAGVRWTLAESDDLTVPATPDARRQLTHASRLEEGS